jgi:hypothetical protein
MGTNKGVSKIPYVQEVYDQCCECPTSADLRIFPTPHLKYYKGKPYCPIHYPVAVDRDKDKRYADKHKSFIKDFRKMVNP